MSKSGTIYRLNQGSSKNKIKNLSLIAATALSVIACGSSNSSSNNPSASKTFKLADLPADTVNKVGWVTFEYYDGPVADVLGLSEGVVEAY